MSLPDPDDTMTLEFFSATDTGRARNNNEDSVAVDEPSCLIVLADGMGGYNAGEVASEDPARAGGQESAAFRSLDGDWQGTFDAVILGVSNPRTVGQKRVCTVTIKLSGDITEVSV